MQCDVSILYQEQQEEASSSYWVEEAPELGILLSPLPDALVTEWCLKMQGSIMTTQELLEESGP